MTTPDKDRAEWAEAARVVHEEWKRKQAIPAYPWKLGFAFILIVLAVLLVLVLSNNGRSTYPNNAADRTDSYEGF